MKKIITSLLIIGLFTPSFAQNFIEDIKIEKESSNLDLRNTSSGQYTKAGIRLRNLNPGTSSYFHFFAEKTAAGASGYSNFIFRKIDNSGRYLNHLLLDDQTNNIIFNISKNSTQDYGDFVIANGDVQVVSGNLGVGTTPNARLDIKGTSNSYSFEHFIVRDQYSNKDFVIRGDGSVEIGYDVDVPNGYKLGVGGRAIMEEVTVKLKGTWPDHVFSDDHPLVPLSELEHYVRTNHHLPGIPSAQEVEENGIHLGELNTKLLEKVEELTLYVIELSKENASLWDQNKLILRELENLKTKGQ